MIKPYMFKFTEANPKDHKFMISLHNRTVSSMYLPYRF